MWTIVRAAERFETHQAGISTWNCFSAGAHYDPANTSFGRLIGLDEHLVEPGNGFATHAHRGVDLVSWVLSGTLRHEDDAGRLHLIRPGQVQLHSSGSGIRHSEVSGSDEPLHFVQMTVLGGSGAPRYQLGDLPLELEPGRFDVAHGAGRYSGARVHLFIARGSCALVDGTVLAQGDSLRADSPVEVARADEALVWCERGLV